MARTGEEGEYGEGNDAPIETQHRRQAPATCAYPILRGMMAARVLPAEISLDKSAQVIPRKPETTVGTCTLGEVLMLFKRLIGFYKNSILKIYHIR